MGEHCADTLCRASVRVIVGPLDAFDYRPGDILKCHSEWSCRRFGSNTVLTCVKQSLDDADAGYMLVMYDCTIARICRGHLIRVRTEG